MINFKEDYRKNAVAITIYTGVVLLCILVLRLFYLQIIAGAYYSVLADNIRARVIPEIAPRGIIYDRYGKILAESRVIYSLDILPYQIKDQKKILNFLKAINVDTKAISKILVEKKYLPYELLQVKKNISIKEISYIEENKQNLEGVVISSRIIRYYPNNKICSHILGYVGEINSKELSNLKKYGYQIGDIIGLAGLERYYDKYLKGVDGGQPLEVDPLGHPVKKLASIEPVPGANIYSTIDLGMQVYAEKVFGEKQGAVVIVDPQTGEVLTMFSKPNYDPNYFTDFLSDQEWEEIRSTQHPLHNRALSGYPPGSTFKIITAFTALEDRIVTKFQNYYCPGYLRLGGKMFMCWNAAGHGKINFMEGFMQSCNVVFYSIGLLLDPDHIAKNAAFFGLGLSTDIDLPYETTGLIPTQRWKLRQYKQQWYPGDSMNMAIGQGFVLTSPLQMCLVSASLANEKHQLLRPFLIKRVQTIDGNELMQRKPEVASTLPFSEENIILIKSLMADVVSKGTGQRVKIEGLAVAGKSGTSEVYRVKKPHAWFISYAPVQNPKLAMAVFVESGGYGGEVAAGISSEIYKWWKENRSEPDAK